MKKFNKSILLVVAILPIMSVAASADDAENSGGIGGFLRRGVEATSQFLQKEVLTGPDAKVSHLAKEYNGKFIANADCGFFKGNPKVIIAQLSAKDGEQEIRFLDENNNLLLSEKSATTQSDVSVNSTYVQFTTKNAFAGDSATTSPYHRRYDFKDGVIKIDAVYSLNGKDIQQNCEYRKEGMPAPAVLAEPTKDPSIIDKAGDFFKKIGNSISGDSKDRTPAPVEDRSVIKGDNAK